MHISKKIIFATTSPISFSQPTNEQNKELEILHDFCTASVITEIQPYEYLSNLLKIANSNAAIQDRKIFAILTNNTLFNAESTQFYYPKTSNEYLNNILHAINEDRKYLKKYLDILSHSPNSDNEINENPYFVIETCKSINQKCQLLEERCYLFDESLVSTITTFCKEIRLNVAQVQCNILDRLLSKQFINIEKEKSVIELFNLCKNECFSYLFKQENQSLTINEAYKIMDFSIRICDFESKIGNDFICLDQLQQKEDKIKQILTILEEDLLSIDKYELPKLDLIMVLYTGSILINSQKMCNRITTICNNHLYLIDPILQESNLSQYCRITKPTNIYNYITSIIKHVAYQKHQYNKPVHNLIACCEEINNFYYYLLEYSFTSSNYNTIFNIPKENYDELFNRENINETTRFLYELFIQTAALEDTSATSSRNYITHLHNISSNIKLNATPNKPKLATILSNIEEIQQDNIAYYANEIKLLFKIRNLSSLLLNYNAISSIAIELKNPTKPEDIRNIAIKDNTLFDVIKSKNENTSYIEVKLTHFYLNNKANKTSKHKQPDIILQHEDGYNNILSEENKNNCLLYQTSTLLQHFIKHFSSNELIQKDNKNNQIKFQLPIDYFKKFMLAKQCYNKMKTAQKVTYTNLDIQNEMCDGFTNYCSDIIIYVLSSYLTNNKYDLLGEKILDFSENEVLHILTSSLQQIQNSNVKQLAIRVLVLLLNRAIANNGIECNFSRNIYQQIQKDLYKSILTIELKKAADQYISSDNFHRLIDIIFIFTLAGNYAEANKILKEYKKAINLQVNKNTISKCTSIYTNTFALCIDPLIALVQYHTKKYNEQEITQSIQQDKNINEVTKIIYKLIPLLQQRFDRETTIADILYNIKLSTLTITKEEQEALEDTSEIEKYKYVQDLNHQHNKTFIYAFDKRLRMLYFDKLKVPARFTSIPSLVFDSTADSEKYLACIEDQPNLNTHIQKTISNIIYPYMKVSGDMQKIPYNINFLATETKSLEKLLQAKAEQNNASKLVNPKPKTKVSLAISTDISATNDEHIASKSQKNNAKKTVKAPNNQSLETTKLNTSSTIINTTATEEAIPTKVASVAKDKPPSKSKKSKQQRKRHDSDTKQKKFTTVDVKLGESQHDAVKSITNKQDNLDTIVNPKNNTGTLDNKDETKEVDDNVVKETTAAIQQHETTSIIENTSLKDPEYTTDEEDNPSKIIVTNNFSYDYQKYMDYNNSYVTADNAIDNKNPETTENNLQTYQLKTTGSYTKDEVFYIPKLKTISERNRQRIEDILKTTVTDNNSTTFDPQEQKEFTEKEILEITNMQAKTLNELHKFDYTISKIIIYRNYLSFNLYGEKECLHNHRMNIIHPAYTMYLKGNIIKVIKTQPIATTTENHVNQSLAIAAIPPVSKRQTSQEVSMVKQPAESQPSTTAIIDKNSYNWLTGVAFNKHFNSKEQCRNVLADCWKMIDNSDKMYFGTTHDNKYKYLNKFILDNDYTFTQKVYMYSIYLSDDINEQKITNYIQKVEQDNNYSPTEKIVMLHAYWHYIENNYKVGMSKKINLASHLNNIVLDSLATDKEKIQKMHPYIDSDIMSLIYINKHQKIFIYHYFEQVIADKNLDITKKTKILTYYQNFANEKVKLVATLFITKLVIQNMQNLLQNPLTFLKLDAKYKNIYIDHSSYTLDVCVYTLLMLIDYALNKEEITDIIIDLKNIDILLTYRDIAEKIVDEIISIEKQLKLITNNYFRIIFQQYNIIQEEHDIFDHEVKQLLSTIATMIDTISTAYQNYAYAYNNPIDKPFNNLLSRVNIKPGNPKELLVAKLLNFKDILQNIIKK